MPVVVDHARGGYWAACGSCWAEFRTAPDRAATIRPTRAELAVEMRCDGWDVSPESIHCPIDSPGRQNDQPRITGLMRELNEIMGR
jgi:hypothetical protein